MTGDELRQDVFTWLDEHRPHSKAVPSASVTHRVLKDGANDVSITRNEDASRPLKRTHEIAFRLAAYPDMRSAWEELAKPKRATDGRQVMSYVFSSAEAAYRECRRSTESEEEKRIQDIMKALEKLRGALSRAPSPMFDSAHFIETDGKPLAFSWRKSGALVADAHMPIMQGLCLDEILEFAQAAIPEISARQPSRKVARQREKPEIAAFVRHLAGLFQHEFGDAMMGTIARIATATYDLHEAVSKEQVERILRRPH